MNYNTLQVTMEQAGGEQPIDALSVYRAFEQIPDGRHKRGVRYGSALLLTLMVLAKLAGMTTLAAIAEWVRLRAEWLNQVLPNPHASFPCAATYSNVLRALEAEQVSQVLNDLLRRVGAMKRAEEEANGLEDPAGQEHHGHVALDGKTLRGTLGHSAPDQKKMHQLTLYETQSGVLLKEQVTGEKQNELSIVSQFLTPVLVQGRIISADALHTQHAFCFTVTRWEGDYLLMAKDNQATLANDLRLFFTEPPADCRDWRTARSVNKGHGRLEIRELVASTELTAFLGGQWRIENRLHWRRDVTLREDACQVRKGEAPRILALLNSFLLALLDLVGVYNVPKQMRRFDADPLLAVRLLLGSLLTFK